MPLYPCRPRWSVGKVSRGDVPAFTLVELLVVLSVLAILASLLLPALRKARTQVQGTVCLNNLKQWGVATLLYAADNDDYLPPEGSPNGLSLTGAWYIDLPRTLGIKPYSELNWRTNSAARLERSIWICPANTNRSNGHNLFHYCLNEHVDGTGDEDRCVRLATVRRPTQVVWLFDNGKRAAVAQQNNVHTNIHSSGAQILFLDGHAKRFRNTAYWDFTADRGRTNNPEIVWTP